MPFSIPRLAKRFHKRRTGFFDLWETEKKKRAWEKLLEQSTAQQHQQNLSNAFLPSLQSIRRRGILEQQRRDKEKPSPFGVDRLLESKALQEEQEKRNRTLDMKEARQRLREVEAKQQPLSNQETKDLLKGRPTPGPRPTLPFINGVPTPTPTPDISEIRRQKGLEKFKEVEARLQPPISKELKRGIYVWPEIKYSDLRPKDFKPLDTIVIDKESIPLYLPLSTSKGRLLADWQAQWRTETELPDKNADKSAARAFNEQINNLRDEIGKELEDNGENPELLGSSVLDMELRRAELFDKALHEWKRQNDTTQEPEDEDIEEIEKQVNAVIDEEFEGLIKIMTYRSPSVLDRAKGALKGVPVLEGLPKMSVGALEILDALIQVSSSTLVRKNISFLDLARSKEEREKRISAEVKIGGFSLVGPEMNKAIPSLFQGLDDYFSGGYEISRPITEAVIPKPLERPLSIGLKYAITGPIRGTEEIAEMFGVKARGEISGKLAAKFTDESAENIIAEVVNPAALIIALPFVGYGLRAGMGVRAAATQITSNLLATGMEPGLIRSTARGITLLAREGPKALIRIPLNVRNTRAFQIAQRNLRSEKGGLRITTDKVTLSPETERVLELADTGKPIKRSQILGALEQEGIFPETVVGRGEIDEALRMTEAGGIPTEPIRDIPTRPIGETIHAEAEITEHAVPVKTRVERLKEIEDKLMVAGPKERKALQDEAIRIETEVDVAEVLAELDPKIYAGGTIKEEIKKLEQLVIRGGKGVSGTGRQAAIEKRIKAFKRLVEPEPLSDESLLLALRNRKQMFERMLVVNKTLGKTIDIPVELRGRLSGILKLGNKAKIKNLQAIANELGIPGYKNLSKTRLIDNLSTFSKVVVESTEFRIPRVVMEVVPPKPGAVFGPLANRPIHSVAQVFKDVMQGNRSGKAIRPLRRVVEQELQKAGRSAEDVWNSGDWVTLGREVRSGEAIPVRIAENIQKLLTSENPAEKIRGVADEVAELGGRGGGVSKPPTEPLSPRLPDPPVNSRHIPKLNSLKKIAADFEHEMKHSAAAGLARIIGKAPPARAMIKFFNPTPFFEGRVGYALGGFLHKYQAEEALASSILRSMKAEEKGLWKFTNNLPDWHGGVILKSRKGKVITPEYLFEFPNDIIRVDRKGNVLGGLNKKQRKFLDGLHSMGLDLRKYEKSFGVEVDEIAEGIEEGRWFHREVIEAPSIEIKESLVNGRGAIIDYKRGFQKDRQFASMYDGMQNGVKYGDGVSENFMARVRAGKMASLDKEVLQMMADGGEQAAIKTMITSHQKGTEVGAIKALEMFNNVARPMMTNVDLGFIGLQLFPAMMRNPVAGLRGITMAFDGFFTDGRYMASYMRKALDDGTLVDFLNNGGLWNQAEFTFEYAAKGGLGFFNKGIFARGNAAFANTLNLATLETYKGMVGVNDLLYRALGNRRASHLITRAFAGFAPVEGKTAKQQAASVANKLTLRMDSAAIGISRGQRGFEAGMLFAPRYYRAFFGLFADALQGGMRGAEARRSLGQMFAGYLGLSMGLQYATGQEIELNPLDKNFWTVKVGDVHIGPGGPFVSLMSLIGKAKNNPEKLLEWDVNENPLLRWGRGKLSPAVSTIIDFLDKQNYMFEERDISNPMDWVYMMSERFEPFAVQAGWETYTRTKDLQSIGIAIGGELLAGTRTWPESRKENRNDARNEAAERLHEEGLIKSSDYDDLNQMEQAKVNEEKDVVESQKELDEYWKTRGSSWAMAREQEEDALKQWEETGRVVTDTGTIFTQDTTQTQDNTLFNLTGSGDIDGQAWISRYRNREDGYYAFRDGLRVGLETVSKSDEEPTNKVDAAINAYFEIIPRNYLDQDGEVKWDEYWPDKDGAFEKAVQLGGPEMKKYLRPYEEDPVIAEYKEVGILHRRFKDEIPKYRFVTKEQEHLVKELEDAVTIATREAKDAGVKGVPTHRELLGTILMGMERNNPLYNIVATAFIRKTDARELMWNPERDQLVLDNPMLVKFYISYFNNMNEADQIRFLQIHGLKYFSKDYIEEEGLESRE